MCRSRSGEKRKRSPPSDFSPGSLLNESSLYLSANQIESQTKASASTDPFIEPVNDVGKGVSLPLDEESVPSHPPPEKRPRLQSDNDSNSSSSLSSSSHATFSSEFATPKKRPTTHGFGLESSFMTPEKGERYDFDFSSPLFSFPSPYSQSPHVSAGTPLQLLGCLKSGSNVRVFFSFFVSSFLFLLLAYFFS